jgi:hypothetical protein
VNLIATRLLPDEVHQFQRQQRLALGDVQDAILMVGRGRGFIVQPRLGLYPEVPVVLTAAHCLPHLPPSPSFRMEERTYPRLLGPLDSSEPSIWAECVFVDPIADIAVLGEPDERNLHEECLAYRELVGNECERSHFSTIWRCSALSVEAEKPLLGLKKHALDDFDSELNRRLKIDGTLWAAYNAAVWAIDYKRPATRDTVDDLCLAEGARLKEKAKREADRILETAAR